MSVREPQAATQSSAPNSRIAGRGRLVRETVKWLAVGFGLTSLSVILGWSIGLGASQSADFLPLSQWMVCHRTSRPSAVCVTAVGPFSRVVEVRDWTQAGSGALSLEEDTARIGRSQRELTLYAESAFNMPQGPDIRWELNADAPWWYASQVDPALVRSGVDHPLQVTDGLGWPMSAITGTVLFGRRIGGAPSYLLELQGGAIMDDPGLWQPTSPRAPPIPWKLKLAPFQPIWAGLFVDTVLWGCCAFFGWSGYRSIRRAVRRRSGACEGCGYARGNRAGAACPECGSVTA